MSAYAFLRMSQYLLINFQLSCVVTWMLIPGHALRPHPPHQHRMMRCVKEQLSARGRVCISSAFTYTRKSSRSIQSGSETLRNIGLTLYLATKRMARQQQDATRTNGKRMWIIIGGIIFAVLIFAAFMSRRREIPVRASVAEKTTITAAIQTNGKIEPINGFEAHSPYATTVKKVLVGQGGHVKAGQLILQLDDADAVARAATAAAQIANADANLNAVKQGGTREEVLTVQADLTRARADRDAAQRNLDAMRRLQQKGAASAGEVADAENRYKSLQAQVDLLW